MPGTHSKWAWAEAGSLTGFETAMTGEVYALLSERSILGRLTTGSEDFRPDAFERGLEVARTEGRSLLAKLFSARSLALFDRLNGEDIRDYLSGLLIGSEFAGALRDPDDTPLVVIGRGDLAARYKQAAHRFGMVGAGRASGPRRAAICRRVFRARRRGYGCKRRSAWW